MARLAFPDPDAQDSEARRVADAVRTRRDGQLLNLYGMMLHNPAVAERWMALATELRFGLSMPARLRELVISCVGRLTGSAYEWAHHAPLAAAEGVTAAQLAALPVASVEDGFSEQEVLALRHTACVVNGQPPPPDLWAALTAVFSEREIVDLTCLAAFYTGTAAFLNTLDVDIDPDAPPTSQV